MCDHHLLSIMASVLCPLADYFLENKLIVQ